MIDVPYDAHLCPNYSLPAKSLYFTYFCLFSFFLFSFFFWGGGEREKKNSYHLHDVYFYYYMGGENLMLHRSKDHEFELFQINVVPVSRVVAMEKNTRRRKQEKPMTTM